MPRRARLVVWLTLGLLLADQLTKWWVIHHWHLGESVPVLPGVFHLTLVRNPGVAFGMLPHLGGMVLGVVTAVIVGLVLFSCRREVTGAAVHPLVPWGAGLILGGAVGNLLDRLRFGGVVDFLDFRIWPVFNVADSGITMGTILLIWVWWRR